LASFAILRLSLLASSLASLSGPAGAVEPFVQEENILPDPECVTCVPLKAVVAEHETGNPADDARLPVLHVGGGGGNRTRVRKRFREGVYVRGLII